MLPGPAGHDIKDDINPIEAGLLWTIGKRRREKWDFVGGEALQKLHADKSHTHRRVGFFGQKGAPAREGAEIQTPDGKKVGAVEHFMTQLSVPRPPTQSQFLAGEGRGDALRTPTVQVVCGCSSHTGRQALHGMSQQQTFDKQKVRGIRSACRVPSHADWEVKGQQAPLTPLFGLLCSFQIRCGEGLTRCCLTLPGCHAGVPKPGPVCFLCCRHSRSGPERRHLCAGHVTCIMSCNPECSLVTASG